MLGLYSHLSGGGDTIRSGLREGVGQSEGRGGEGLSVPGAPLRPLASGSLGQWWCPGRRVPGGAALCAYRVGEPTFGSAECLPHELHAESGK